MEVSDRELLDIMEVTTTLEQLETVIERGRQTFVEVGRALMEIRDGRLYRQCGYDTFEDYCQQRWGWKRQHGYELIQAAQAFENVRSNVQDPPSLTQAVQLASLSPEQQRAIAEQVDFSTTTVRELKEVIQQAKQPERLAVHFSSDSDEWYTPPEIIERTIRVFDAIDLDPCSNSQGAPNVPAAYCFTREDDGLAQEWRGKVYMNPPYGRAIMPWIEKLCFEYAAGRVPEAIALVPARTDTDWFRRLRNCAVCFIDGRLKFSGMANSAPFPSAVIYFGDNIAAFSAAFETLGDVWVRWEK